MQTAESSNFGARLEAEKSIQDKDVMTVLVSNYNDTELRRDFPQEEVSQIVSTRIGEETFRIPIPRRKSLDKWTIQSGQWIAETEEFILDISEFRSEAANSIEDAKQKAQSAKIDTSPQKRQIAQTVLRLQLLEREWQRWLQRLADQSIQVRARIDPATDGLWLSQGAMDTKQVTIAKRFSAVEKVKGMSYTNTQNIGKMLFSRNASIRAEAKLNLSANFDDRTFHRIAQEPEKMLAIACVQAQLTPIETLAVVLPTKDKAPDNICIACGTASVISSMMYHPKCQVIEWLLKHAPFTYDEKEGLLKQEKREYFSASQRGKLVKLLDLHHKLHKDIVVKHEGGTTVWSRNDKGILMRSELNRIPLDEQVGSYAWRTKHGFSK